MRNLILMLLLGAAALASWIYSLPATVDAPQRASGEGPPQGYYLRGARLSGTDETGHVAYRILADKLEGHADDERLLLERVRIEYRPANEVPWIITAGSGTAPKDGSRLELGGGVELRSEPADGTTIQISTDELTFEPGTSTAASSRKTELKVGDWQLSGTGLVAHLKDERLKLESEVHGKFSR